MTRSTLALSMILAISLLVCAVLAYLWIDRSISLSYMTQSYETERSSVENLQRLIVLEWKGIPESRLQEKLESAAAKMPDRSVVVKNEGSVIWFDQVAFNIKNGRLDSVGSPSR